jgi:prolipoprotein diacylglyceryltransferase
VTAGLLAAIVFDFDPYLRLGERAVRWETLGIAAAVLVGIVFAAFIAGRTPGDDQWIGEEELPEEERERPWHLRRDDLLFILLGAVPGAVVLGRLGYGLLHLDYYGGNWRALLDPGQGSMELTLAVVGGTLTAVYVAALLDAPVGRWLHVTIAPLLLVLGLGKAAQALGGSGQGAAAAAAWATAYAPPGPWGSPGAEIPAHPAQLCEAAMTAAVLLLVVALVRLTPLRRADGRLYLVGVGLWALGRCLVASRWRDPDVLGQLNAEQLICLVVATISIGAGVATTIVHRRARSPRPAP